jgi:hypothetical protein
MKVHQPRFTIDDAHRAFDDWGANCGPGAIAAMVGMTLDELRPHMGDFESKRYTNPTLMFHVLRSVGAQWSCNKLGDKCGGATCTFVGWPKFGLARVQWEGPWTQPGVPMRARYRYTHWVGTAFSSDGKKVGIFDINCMNNGSGWVSSDDWKAVIVPWLLGELYKRANGLWHITHAIELQRDAEGRAVRS